MSATNGPLPAQQLEEDDAQRVDVRAGVDGPSRVELLRSHVGERAEAVAAIGGAAREAEVQDPGPKRRVDEDVAGLQVAVLDAEVVGALEGVGHVRQRRAFCLGSSERPIVDSSKPSTYSMRRSGGSPAR